MKATSLLRILAAALCLAACVDEAAGIAPADAGQGEANSGEDAAGDGVLIDADDPGAAADASDVGGEEIGEDAVDAAEEPLEDVAEDTPPVEDAPSADPCQAIAPSADPAAHHARIEGCLRERGEAVLLPGEHPISATVDMPDGSRLRGDTTWPRLVLMGGGQAVVRMHDDAEVAFLRLDANHNLTVPHGGAAMFSGSRSFLHDCHVQNADGARGEDRVTGVRFSNTDGRDNRAFRNQIHHLHYGVIFDTYPNGAQNVLEGNQIYEIRCDGVTFRGFGVARDNVISRSGWQCLNPPESPIPGGGFYTLENAAGAELVGNHVLEVCGTPLDLDRARRLVIRGNTFERPGWRWDGHDACGSGATAHLIDIGESVIEDNTFLNDGRHGIGADPNLVMSAGRTGVPTDLPSGARQAVAFMLTHRLTSRDWTTTHNTITANRFIASCAAPCVGLGWFAGRGTGYDADGGWSASTTNYFRGNSPFGSNIGSKRCGGNWYAADRACAEGGGDAECNVDDYQHEGGAHDWARNDGCSSYE